MVNFTKTADELETVEDKWLYLLKHAGSSDKLPKFNDDVLDDAVARITVDPGKDKELLEAQVACTMSIDEQIGRIVLAHQEGCEEGLERGRKESEETIAKLQAESAADKARIKELEVLLAKKG